MASLNQCNFIGNVGKIETRYMTSGEAVTNISLACNETWKDKSGEKQERCEWVSCVMYRRLAEIAAEYVKVGQQLFISGKMATRKWQTKEGQDRYTTEIVVNEMTMLGGKSQGGEHSAPAERDSNPAGRPGGSPSKPAPDSQSNTVASTTKTGAFDNFDDDIPF